MANTSISIKRFPAAMDFIASMRKEQDENQKRLQTVVPQQSTINPYQHIKDLFNNGFIEKMFLEIERLDDPLRNSATAFLFRGWGYQEQGDNYRALKALEKSVSLDPSNALLWNSIATIKADFKRYPASLRDFLKAQSIDPDNIAINLNIMLIFLRLHQLDKACQQLEEIKNTKDEIANDIRFLAAAFEVYALSGCHDEAMEVAPRIKNHINNLDVDYHLRRSMRYSAFFHGNYFIQMSLTDHLVRSRAWARYIENQVQKMLPSVTTMVTSLPEDGEIVRVGYLSAGFHNCAGISGLRKLFSHHNRKRFEIHAIYTNTIVDSETRKLQADADGWHVVKNVNTVEACEKIRKLKLHIVICHSVITESSPFNLIAMRLAPIQATLFHFNTAGLKAVDYCLTHPYVMPPAGQALCTEKLIYLKEGSPSFDPPDILMAKRKLSPCKRLEGEVVFGCYNNWRKMGRANLQMIAQIAHACPRARFVFKNPQVSERDNIPFLLEKLIEVGIDKSRVQFLEYFPYLANLGAYAEADIALDSFPFSGAITTFETLWMGTPIVTYKHGTIAGRSSALILHETGLDELIGESIDEMIDIAVALAHNPQKIEEYHLTLRDMMRNSCYCNPDKNVANLEAGFEAMIQDMGANNAKK